MANHDFKKGQSICTLLYPSLETDNIQILIGTITQKYRAPTETANEFCYDFQTSDGRVFHNRPGIYVYGSLEELYEDVMHDLDNAVEDSDKFVQKCSKDLAAAKRECQRIKALHKKWTRLMKVYGKQAEEG